MCVPVRGRIFCTLPDAGGVWTGGLRAAGVNYFGTDRRFAGMTFVLTGALEKFTREEAGEMIERRGGKAASSV